MFRHFYLTRTLIDDAYSLGDATRLQLLFQKLMSCEQDMTSTAVASQPQFADPMVHAETCLPASSIESQEFARA